MITILNFNQNPAQPQQWPSIWSAAVLLLVVGLIIPGTPIAQNSAVFRVDRLAIENANGRRILQVEIAETPRQRAQGLMWRQHMAPGTGMLFDFKITRPVVMWMKNTYVSLDIFFITEKGIVLNIARNTTPHSTQNIPSAGPVRAVLELPAGSARKYGIRAGDQVRHAMFAPRAKPE